MSAENYTTSSKSVRMSPTSGGDRETIDRRKSTPHPKSFGAYSPPADEYGTDPEDSDCEVRSDVDEDGNRVQYMVGSGRVKIGGSSKRSKSGKKSKSPSTSRSNTFQEAYANDDYHTDSDFSEAEYEEYVNAQGDREHAMRGNGMLRTHTAESVARREKSSKDSDERKEAKLQKKYKKMAKRMMEEERAGVQYVTDPARAGEEPQYRKIRTAEGYAEEATGNNALGIHTPESVRKPVPSGSMVRAH